MSILSSLVVEFAAKGHQQLLEAERQVQEALQWTADTAASTGEETLRWMERHKTALSAIGVATSGLLLGIVAASPSLTAALGGIMLWFSLLAMEVGEELAPQLEWLEGKTEDLYDWFVKLPEPLKFIASTAIVAGLGLVTLGIAVGLLKGPIGWLYLAGAWLIGWLKSLVIYPLACATGMTALGFSTAVFAGVLAAGIVVWGLWKIGALQALEDAGWQTGLFISDTMQRFDNLKSYLLRWCGLVLDTGKWFWDNFWNVVSGNEIDASRWKTLQDRFTSLMRGFDINEGITKHAEHAPDATRFVSNLVGALDKLAFGYEDTGSKIEQVNDKINLSTTDSFGYMSKEAEGWGESIVGNATKGMQNEYAGWISMITTMERDIDRVQTKLGLAAIAPSSTSSPATPAAASAAAPSEFSAAAIRKYEQMAASGDAAAAAWLARYAPGGSGSTTVSTAVTLAPGAVQVTVPTQADATTIGIVVNKAVKDALTKEVPKALWTMTGVRRPTGA